MKNQPQRLVLKWMTALLLALFALSGCGGSGASNLSQGDEVGPGIERLVLRVTWPDSTRLIPFKTQSLRISIDWVKDGTETSIIESHVVDRPDPLKTLVSETVYNVPTGSGYRLTVTAHPNAGGTGTALARFVSPANLSVHPGGTSEWPVTLISTIKTISIEPAVTSIGIGEKKIVSAVARDASGSTVLLAFSSIAWMVGNPGTLIGNRNVLGLADNEIQLEGLLAGTSTVSVMDQESGQSSQSHLITVGRIIVAQGSWSGTYIWRPPAGPQTPFSISTSVTFYSDKTCYVSNSPLGSGVGTWTGTNVRGCTFSFESLTAFMNGVVSSDGRNLNGSTVGFTPVGNGTGTVYSVADLYSTGEVNP